MRYMNGCGGVVTAGDPVYGLVIPLRLLLAACVCYPPVAQTRFAQTVGLVVETSLHLVTQAS